jgi:protein-disulfide isomerase
MPAARAAECAERVGRFSEWIDAVYRKQDSLGVKSWGSYAHDAGIADSSMIAACARDTVPVPNILAGLAYGDSVGVTGTPTILVNGWRLPQPPSKARLSEIIELTLKGEDAFAKDRWTQK